MIHADYQARLVDALSALVPLAFMERAVRAGGRRERPVTVADMLPDEAEREALVSRLVMADDLAIGSFGSKSKGSLAALAKALAALSCAPQGVLFLGRRWVAEDSEYGPKVKESLDVR